MLSRNAASARRQPAAAYRVHTPASSSRSIPLVRANAPTSSGAERTSAPTGGAAPARAPCHASDRVRQDPLCCADGHLRADADPQCAETGTSRTRAFAVLLSEDGTSRLAKQLARPARTPYSPVAGPRPRRARSTICLYKVARHRSGTLTSASSSGGWLAAIRMSPGRSLAPRSADWQSNRAAGRSTARRRSAP
jgi:hypothetical protein